MADGAPVQTDGYRRLAAILAAILGVIVGSGALFAYLNQHYIVAWYGKVTGAELTVSPFLQQRVEAFSVTPAVTPNTETLVFVGDSLIETFPWEEHFADREHLTVVNRGIYGDTIKGLAERFDVSFLVNRQPTIVMMIGANDIGPDASCSERFIQAYGALLERLLAAHVPAKRIYVNGLLPARRPDKSNAAIVACNAALRRMTEKLGLHYIDLYSVFADEVGELNAAYSLADGHEPAEVMAAEGWLAGVRGGRESSGEFPRR